MRNENCLVMGLLFSYGSITLIASHAIPHIYIYIYIIDGVFVCGSVTKFLKKAQRAFVWAHKALRFQPKDGPSACAGLYASELKTSYIIQLGEAGDILPLDLQTYIALHQCMASASHHPKYCSSLILISLVS